MKPFEGARILVGVCGGIAAYKVAGLVSTLVQRGADVTVMMTDAAQRFVTTLTFAALSGNPVHTSLWEEPESIPHIRLARDADVFLIAPATANTIAKLAQGLADDLLSSTALATEVPIVVAPAMNVRMYANAAIQAHMQALEERRYRFVPPEAGFLAERETGIGRLAAEPAILEALASTLAQRRQLAGLRLTITAGPTREAIDPVRFISNASTGTTGIELAREAALRGAEVDLILGPTIVKPPSSARVTRVTTAREMNEAAQRVAPGSDIVIATAAVSDWRPAQHSEQKVKKDGGAIALEMTPNPDVLAELGARKNGTFLVGFAAETDDIEQNARRKMVAKNLDAIAVNDVSAQAGFGEVENRLIVLWGTEGRRDLGNASKSVLARRLLDEIVALRNGVAH